MKIVEDACLRKGGIKPFALFVECYKAFGLSSNIAEDEARESWKRYRINDGSQVDPEIVDYCLTVLGGSNAPQA